ncbi:1825_t:CDS:2 [Ambispora gerdemannii]|uniref:1825_t:CDS:1 n=1 Tax=Ambispora gerdemannii TaxID=144530 RepID=A0A9N9B992_9GLOM|nr:1825_t:CDS:2 [Ambispora gerdemannii]
MGANISSEAENITPSTSEETQKSSGIEFVEQQPQNTTIEIKNTTIDEKEENTRYAIPQDIKEKSSQEIQHYILRYFAQGNFLSPIHQHFKSEKNNDDNTLQILDFNCGPTGTWAKEISREFPEAKVLGVVINDSEIPSTSKDEESNLKFIKHNLSSSGEMDNRRLPFASNTFDFVHSRFLLNEIKEDDIENTVISEFVRVAKPSGYIELVECDVRHFSDGPSTRKLTNAMLDYLKSKGHNGQISDNLARYLHQTSQVGDIRRHDKAIPLGRWAGQIGELAIQSLTDLFRKTTGLPASMKMSSVQFQELLSSYRQEVEIRRTFCKARWFYTQKIAE